MSTEEKQKIEHSLLSGSQMILDELGERLRDTSEHTLAEIKCISETMGYISDIYKDVAKVHYYEVKM